MCEVLEVSSSGYYDWLGRPISVRQQRHARLVSQIQAIHRQSRGLYGSPRIHSELVDTGMVVGKNTVARLMQRYRIQSRVHKRFVVTTQSRHGLKPAENVLNQDR